MYRESVVLAVSVMAIVAIVWAPAAAADDTPIGSRVGTQQVVGGRQTDGGALPLSLTAEGYTKTTVTSGSIVASPQTCPLMVQTVVSVGITAGGVTIPTSSAANRRDLMICASAENPGFPKVKCQVDPAVGKPVMGLAEKGDVLQVGALVCVTYPIDASHTVRCIADTAATAVTTLECVP